ncbi:Titin [Folsomia candida]|uniref:Titin n=1 Tax=Folsomia candida TaxID=158441 RepID=A0A226F4A7_FOLCA|nr:Titin [Folsomia candida]
MKCKVKLPVATFWTVDGLVPDEGKSLSDPSRPSENIAPSRQAHSYSTTKEVHALVGAECTLSCNAQARPYPKFTWVHNNGTIIQNQSGFTIATNHEDVSNLTILLRDSTFYGEYICEAWNTLGKSETVFLLKMPEKPNDIPFLYPKVIGSKVITLGVSFENMKVNNYTKIYVQFRKILDVVWNGTSKDGKAETVELVNLEENTTYVIRAAVRNEYVLGDYSDPIHVTTDKGVRNSDDASSSSPNNIHPSSRRLFHSDDSIASNDNSTMSFSNNSSDDGFGFTSKVVDTKTLSTKFVSKVGDKFIITTNTSTVEEIWSGIENYK